MLVSEVVPGVRDGIDADMGEKLDLERLSPRKLLDLVDEPTYRERERERARESERQETEPSTRLMKFSKSPAMYHAERQGTKP